MLNLADFFKGNTNLVDSLESFRDPVSPAGSINRKGMVMIKVIGGVR